MSNKTKGLQRYLELFNLEMHREYGRENYNSTVFRLKPDSDLKRIARRIKCPRAISFESNGIFRPSVLLHTTTHYSDEIQTFIKRWLEMLPSIRKSLKIPIADDSAVFTIPRPGEYKPHSYFLLKALKDYSLEGLGESDEEELNEFLRSCIRKRNRDFQSTPYYP